jgi:hypothetical protein
MVGLKYFWCLTFGRFPSKDALRISPEDLSMKTLDFPRSFVTFRIDTLKKPPVTVSHKPLYSLNNARIQMDCRYCRTEKQSGQEFEFFLGASCKTERVGVERDIWLEPNADFVPVFSKNKFMHIKTYDRADRTVLLYPPSLGVQPERMVANVEETFDRLRIDPCEREGELLESIEQIIQSTLANDPLIARTEIENERYLALVEYPIKTMNVNEREKVYQTDTGPILFPDLSRDPDDLLDGLELAFVAEHVAARDAHVIEKDFVELGFAGHLPQRAGLHAGAVHVHHEGRQSGVLGHVGIGAHHQQAPASHVGEGGPHLLAIDDPLIAVAQASG